MQFLLLIYQDESGYYKADRDTINAEIARYEKFGRDYEQAILGSNALQHTPSARTVRVRDGRTFTTDGPFAETKEQLGGYFLVEAKDIDEAASIAAHIPAALHGSIEVRPVWIIERQTAT